MSDMIYLWLLLLCMALAAYAQWSIRSAYEKYSQIRSARSLSSHQMVNLMLRQENIDNVAVEHVGGTLSDHYDPRNLTLRLSGGVAGSDSVAALAVAAHEMGHVLQHRDGYAPLALRSWVAPSVQIGSSLAGPLMLLGLLLEWYPLIQVGVLLYALITLFTFITLPVEFNASRRALLLLESGGYLTREELPGARKVLSDAALTYVASALTALIQFLRLLSRFRRRER